MLLLVPLSVDTLLSSCSNLSRTAAHRDILSLTDTQSCPSGPVWAAATSGLLVQARLTPVKICESEFSP
jgi:hypothetical protein